MIAIVDYGLGNIEAFKNIYKRLAIPVTTAQTAGQLAGASKIILPGVGSFDWAMQKLEDSGMRPQLDQLVLQQQMPVLGICVGMQMMARSSEEGKRAGLGWLDATVRLLPAVDARESILLPHMGWNDAVPSPSGLFTGLPAPRFYFLHSYYFECQNPQDRLAVTTYGGQFTSAVAHGNIFGVQFHPEKSHQWGMRLLKNFAEL
ncbi:MAG TPA: imidazole glycerol phosphate synthase subunit HisH [Opitutaceae bacterium]|nr:imidazole glycerol phosphate synthase subunit HisH [Opitutaceae bacterium]